MKQKTKLHTLGTALLFAAAALGLAGCTADDDLGRLPQGSIPLQIGNVNVGGVPTARSNSPGNASTRAAITEDAAGMTGIRKTTFVEGDKLEIELTNPQNGGTVTNTVTATLTAGDWVLNASDVYITPGTTALTATHSPAISTLGMEPDYLTADTYTLDGQKLTLDMKHAHALVDITCTAGVTPTGIDVTAQQNGTDKTLNTVAEEEADGSVHHRAIAAPGTVSVVTATLNGVTYTAALATPLAVEANKRYPISLTLKAGTLTASVGSAGLDWGIGGETELLPGGYTHYIGTPEDLAQFAWDTRTTLDASAAVVLQTADIDLSKLMTVAEANAARPGKNYTYIATKDAWESIDHISAAGFYGKYNGNGHTISNLKGTNPLFLNANNATLTGIHLRDVHLTGEVVGGSLVSTADGCTITLCSATGTISGSSAYSRNIGGLIECVYGGSTITRCSADVAVTCTTGDGGGTKVGGLIGELDNSTLAGCLASGKVTNGNASAGSYTGGLVGSLEFGSTMFGCLATGEVSAPANAGALVGKIRSGNAYYSYATGAVTGGASSNFSGGGSGSFTGCAYTDTQTSATTGITGSVAVAGLYAIVGDIAGVSGNVLKTLHWSAADGYTFTEVSETWEAPAMWKDNGTAAPTIDMAYEGGTPLNP